VRSRNRPEPGDLFAADGAEGGHVAAGPALARYTQPVEDARCLLLHIDFAHLLVSIHSSGAQRRGILKYPTEPGGYHLARDRREPFDGKISEFTEAQRVVTRNKAPVTSRYWTLA